jgi:hypothetical protein
MPKRRDLLIVAALFLIIGWIYLNLATYPAPAKLRPYDAKTQHHFRLFHSGPVLGLMGG